MFKIKFQTLVATSTMESEFITVVTAAKTWAYLGSVLEDLVVSQNVHAEMRAHNVTAMCITNHSSRSTPHTTHVDISWFTMQDWVKNKLVAQYHVTGVVNPSHVPTCSMVHFTS